MQPVLLQQKCHLFRVRSPPTHSINKHFKKKKTWKMTSVACDRAGKQTDRHRDRPMGQSEFFLLGIKCFHKSKANVRKINGFLLYFCLYVDAFCTYNFSKNALFLHFMPFQVPWVAFSCCCCCCFGCWGIHLKCVRWKRVPNFECSFQFTPLTLDTAAACRTVNTEHIAKSKTNEVVLKKRYYHNLHGIYKYLRYCYNLANVFYARNAYSGRYLLPITMIQ